MLCTATRVNGTVKENASTPTEHQNGPEATRPAEVESGGRCTAIALSLSVMSEDSSVDRLTGALRELILRAAPGTRLPPTRSLAAEHGVGPVTVQRAMQRLAASGLVDTRPAIGNFVASRSPAPVTDLSWQTTALGAVPAFPDDAGQGVPALAPGVIRMNGGYLAPELLPRALVDAALVRAARAGAATVAPSSDGVPELRAWFARELGFHGDTAHAYTEHDVTVTSGGQGAIFTAMRALARPGDTIVMESPTYWGAIAAAREAGLDIAPIARTPDGVDPDDLETALRTHDARLFYAQPTFANPTGTSWTRESRTAVLDVARRKKAFVIEDDWARDLAIDAAPPPLAAADADGHVVYIRALTKSMAPSLRIAGLVARGPARDRLRRSRWISDLFVSEVLQRAALDVVTRPAWNQHVRRLSAALGAHRDALAAALLAEASGLEPAARPRGGVGIWLRLPVGFDAEAVAAGCLVAGLAVSPGTRWFPAEPDAAYLRLSYAGEDASRYEEAARILARVIGAG